MMHGQPNINNLTCSSLIFIKNARFYKQSQILMCCIL